MGAEGAAGPSPLARLQRTVPQIGRLEWIGLSPERRATIRVVDAVDCRVGAGLDGDHHASSSRAPSKRQVTLIQAEHLPVIAGLLERDTVAPADLRRNLMVAGINLWGLRTMRFFVGDVLLEGTGPCAPCSRMEEVLGPGGYHAVRGHGGITARVLAGGLLRVGAPVRLADALD